MSFPDTLVQAAERLLRRIEAGAAELSSPPSHFEENDEHRTFRLTARDGARAYARLLAEDIQQGRIDNELDLQMAELVATAAGCAGWISSTGVASGRNAARDALEEEGYLVFFPAVPGEWVACYRLVAP